MIGRPFQKGTSGNPGGRPKVIAEVHELARQHTTAAVETLVSIMTNPKSAPAARVSAANALLDRGHGKPPQFHTSDATNFRKAVDMTDDELAAIVARAKLTVV
jgi:aminopeptidase N